ncbi:site-specific integrase [Odoribacter laneus]|uniref:site-specific integrase n=2 Tax=Odoribacter laneus TaxID=626933 RepID=UPI00033C04D0|nr:site-specific integrase [Odoribacter laneus]CCZ82077.1 putative uncharacterized protein [Odoribacter laneus CAG:561]
MATVKVKFRKSTVAGKPGSIYYQLCHNGEVKLLAAKIHLYPEYWDTDNDCIAETVQNETAMLGERRIKIDSDLSRLKHIISDFDGRGIKYRITDIISEFQLSENRISVSFFFKEQIGHCKQNKNLGTARNYERALNSFMTFLKGNDVPLTMITESLVLGYEKWLAEKGVTRNSSSFYIRNLRSVYNKAVKCDLVKQCFPFRNVYTGIDRTRKRAVSEETIVRLQKMNLEYSPPLALSRDLFVFSFCTRGMSFVDIVFLKKSDISDGIISYLRRKTGQQLSIRIEPCIEIIISRYSEQTKDSPYIFPVITATNQEEVYKQYRIELNYHNRKLKRLGEELGGNLSLSSYTARHTWATIARKHNVPISVISAGMGHTSEKTTQIYLASLENSVIDKANRGILGALNNMVSM